MKNLLYLFITVLSLTSNAQLTQKKVNLQAKYSMGLIDTAQYHNFSITTEFIVHDYIGLNYNFDLMFRNDNIRQLHTPMGVIGGPLLMGIGLTKIVDGDSNTMGGLVLVGLLILALPDGVSFHIPTAYRWDISPYANLLGIDFVKNRTTDEKFIKYACSFGAKATYVMKDQFTFSTFVETRKTAGMSWGIGGGFGIGILFGEREDTEEEVPL